MNGFCTLASRPSITLTISLTVASSICRAVDKRAGEYLGETEFQVEVSLLPITSFMTLRSLKPVLPGRSRPNSGVANNAIGRARDIVAGFAALRRYRAGLPKPTIAAQPESSACPLMLIVMIRT